MAKTYVIFLFCIFAARCASQAILPGRCLYLPPKEKFNMKKFCGLWNQQESYGSSVFGGSSECSSANYTVSPTTGIIKIEYKQRIVIDRKIQNISGKGIMPDPLTGRILIYYFVPYYGVVTAELIVIGTDYGRWAIVTSCTELAGGHSSAGWILTRSESFKTDPDAASINNEINANLAAVGLNRKMFVTGNDHAECNDIRFS